MKKEDFIKETINEEFKIIKFLWDELKVSENYRKKFERYINSIDDDNNKKEYVELEKKDLKKLRELKIELSKEINNREKNIEILKELCYLLDKKKLDLEKDKNNKLLTDIVSIIQNLRVDSINCILIIKKIKEIYNSNSEKYNVDKIYKDHLYDKKYTLKMKKDMLFIKKTSLNKYFEMTNEKIDPFLTIFSPLQKENISNKIIIPFEDNLFNAIEICRFEIFEDNIFYKKYDDPYMFSINNNKINKENDIMNKSLQRNDFLNQVKEVEEKTGKNNKYIIHEKGNSNNKKEKEDIKSYNSLIIKKDTINKINEIENNNINEKDFKDIEKDNLEEKEKKEGKKNINHKLKNNKLKTENKKVQKKEKQKINEKIKKNKKQVNKKEENKIEENKKEENKKEENKIEENKKEEELNKEEELKKEEFKIEENEKLIKEEETKKEDSKKDILNEISNITNTEKEEESNSDSEYSYDEFEDIEEEEEKVKELNSEEEEENQNYNFTIKLYKGKIEKLIKLITDPNNIYLKSIPDFELSSFNITAQSFSYNNLTSGIFPKIIISYYENEIKGLCKFSFISLNKPIIIRIEHLSSIDVKEDLNEWALQINLFFNFILENFIFNQIEFIIENNISENIYYLFTENFGFQLISENGFNKFKYYNTDDYVFDDEKFFSFNSISLINFSLMKSSEESENEKFFNLFKLLCVISKEKNFGLIQTNIINSDFVELNINDIENILQNSQELIIKCSGMEYVKQFIQDKLGNDIYFNDILYNGKDDCDIITFDLNLSFLNIMSIKYNKYYYNRINENIEIIYDKKYQINIYLVPTNERNIYLIIVEMNDIFNKQINESNDNIYETISNIFKENFNKKKTENKNIFIPTFNINKHLMINSLNNITEKIKIKNNSNSNLYISTLDEFNKINFNNDNNSKSYFKINITKKDIIIKNDFLFGIHYKSIYEITNIPIVELYMITQLYWNKV